MRAASPASDDVVLEVRGLRKQYAGSDTAAVDDVSFTLRRGEVLGLLGPNGAGKTTTVEVLCGFRSRSAGDVRVLGLDPAVPAQLRELRQRVGVVLQQTGHLRYLSAREILEMHHAYHDTPRAVDEVLALVGLEEAAHQRVRTLSGGQARRLDVGVALIGRPDVIFLDEPTTGFDPAARRRAWDVVGELARLGTSVVLTTHYMEEAARLADRLVVMARGRVVGEGTPPELAARLGLGTVVRAAMPTPGEGVLAELPAELREAIDGDGVLELRTDDPTRVLAELCGWAVTHGVRLDGLSARAPDLEDSYLALTGPDASGTGAAPAAELLT